MGTQVIDLAEKLSRFDDRWAPRTVARMNDYDVRVVKIQGEFVWHEHADTDELFLVVAGELTIRLRDGEHERSVVLGPGQLYVVPRGTQHCPSAEGEVHAVLIEPSDVVNTGSAGGARTAVRDESLLESPSVD